MLNSRTLLENLTVQLEAAGVYNRNDQVAPAAVLWPDEQRQWEGLLPQLRARLPLLTLGEYNPESRTGPSYWVRCMIARTLPEDMIPAEQVPIIYLPGFSKQDLRAIEECPKALQPLAELQYRGILWVNPNGRDWTVSGYLHSLDIPVAADKETKEALARSLVKLAHEPVERLQKRAPLDAAFFNELIHPDSVRKMLLWLSDPEVFKEQSSTPEWNAFCDLCRQKYAVDPEKDGQISIAQKLTYSSGEWRAVWQRYEEAPEAYPGIPDLLRRAQPQQLSFFEPSPVWPEYTRLKEEQLRGDLGNLEGKLPEEVRQALSELEQEHGMRREWVWAKLNESPLAIALQSLNTLASLTQKPLGGSDIETIARNYTSWGWKVDAAVLEALAAVEHYEDVAAVKTAVLPLYRPWLEQAAKNMQQVVMAEQVQRSKTGLPAHSYQGTCVIFSDALRFDVARRLQTALEKWELSCSLDWYPAALPTVTATAKPAVSPAGDQFEGGDEPSLMPIVKGSGASATAAQLRSLLQKDGWQILEAGGTNLGDPSGQAWMETGAIDQYGHEHGWKIAHHVNGEIKDLADHVRALLDHGWRRVILVTDHGWLLLPNGMPKAELPLHITHQRKGRCAVLKPGTSSSQPEVSWHWNPNVKIAIARDIYCFEAGKEYEHGGVSPQECILPLLTVESTKGNQAVQIEEVKWRGLRCYVQLAGGFEDVQVDLRRKAGDGGTSIVFEPKQPDTDGLASLIVPNEEHQDSPAFVVILYAGELVAQQVTIVGGA